jgi:hypothetical protein
MCRVAIPSQSRCRASGEGLGATDQMSGFQTAALSIAGGTTAGVVPGGAIPPAHRPQCPRGSGGGEPIAINRSGSSTEPVERGEGTGEDPRPIPGLRPIPQGSLAPNRPLSPPTPAPAMAPNTARPTSGRNDKSEEMPATTAMIAPTRANPASHLMPTRPRRGADRRPGCLTPYRQLRRSSSVPRIPRSPSSSSRRVTRYATKRMTATATGMIRMALIVFCPCSTAGHVPLAVRGELDDSRRDVFDRYLA